MARVAQPAIIFLNATDTADPQPLPDEQIIRLEGIGLVRLSVESLDDRSRELIRLSAGAGGHEGYSFGEVARQAAASAC